MKDKIWARVRIIYHGLFFLHLKKESVDFIEAITRPICIPLSYQQNHAGFV